MCYCTPTIRTPCCNNCPYEERVKWGLTQGKPSMARHKEYINVDCPHCKTTFTIRERPVFQVASVKPIPPPPINNKPPEINKMNDDQLEKIINMNYRVLTLLGIMTAVMMDFKNRQPECEQHKFDWLLNALNDVVYFNKPIPPFPQDRP